MAVSFERVTTPEHVDELSRVADEIWHEYWPPIIGEGQTDYMVDLMLSVPALEHEMADLNYRYWFVRDESGALVGFTGGAAQELTGDKAHDAPFRLSPVVDARWPRRFFISKVYLYASERGKHYATQIIDFYERLCRDEGIPAMWLQVNRDNELGCRCYLGRGFTIAEDRDSDIGHGYVMTDHIMVKEVPPRA
jgi:GNAT superfamily N-acetyltransferase